MTSLYQPKRTGAPQELDAATKKTLWRNGFAESKHIRPWNFVYIPLSTGFRRWSATPSGWKVQPCRADG